MSNKQKKETSSPRTVVVKFRTIKDIEKIVKAPKRNFEHLEGKIPSLHVSVKTKTKD